MGECAEMILDGIICQECGEFIGDAIGFPRSCPDCEVENSFEYDFNFNREAIIKLAKEILNNGTKKQKYRLCKDLKEILESEGK